MCYQVVFMRATCSRQEVLQAGCNKIPQNLRHVGLFPYRAWPHCLTMRLLYSSLVFAFEGQGRLFQRLSTWFITSFPELHSDRSLSIHMFYCIHSRGVFLHVICPQNWIPEQWSRRELANLAHSGRARERKERVSMGGSPPR